jgi:hypothetical protein
VLLQSQPHADVQPGQHPNLAKLFFPIRPLIFSAWHGTPLFKDQPGWSQCRVQALLEMSIFPSGFNAD